jgi:hypothetical protein
MRRTAGAVSGARASQWRQATYTGHNRIGQQSLEGDTHDCGRGVSLWLGWVGEVLSRSHGRNRERVARSFAVHGHASPDSKAKGTHPRSDRTAHLHIEPPSCNYSRCRSAPHIPTNRLRAYFRVPVCAHNCARWRSTPSASPQPRTTRLRASGIVFWHTHRIYDYCSARKHGTGTVGAYTVRENAPRRPTTRLPTTT